jgi:hypothetical protein
MKLLNEEEIKRITPEEILSEYHRALLSPDATKIYAAIWYKMRFNNTTIEYFADEKLSIKARVPLNRIPAARSELSAAGLLEMTPYHEGVQYRFLEECDDEGDLDSLLWQRYTQTK